MDPMKILEFIIFFTVPGVLLYFSVRSIYWGHDWLYTKERKRIVSNFFEGCLRFISGLYLVVFSAYIISVILLIAGFYRNYINISFINFILENKPIALLLWPLFNLTVIPTILWLINGNITDKHWDKKKKQRNNLNTWEKKLKVKEKLQLQREKNLDSREHKLDIRERELKLKEQNYQDKLDIVVNRELKKRIPELKEEMKTEVIEESKPKKDRQNNKGIKLFGG